MLDLLFSLTALDLLCGVYWGLTTAKLLQYGKSRLLHGSSPSTNRVEYAPHLQLVIHVIEHILFPGGKELAKLPRKEFRAITDPWIEEYTRKMASKGNAPRRFTSLEAAKMTFFKEFCQESHAKRFFLLVDSSLALNNHPLGLMATAGVLLMGMGLPLLLVRETVFQKGTAHSLMCKITAAMTITDVYVVCGKEQIDFETAIHRYPWASELFLGHQPHPLIGRAVCPAYKRKIGFPPNDVLAFDYEFVAVPKGMGYVRQKYHHFLWDAWERLTVVHSVILLATVSVISHHGISLAVEVVAPSAFVFYTTRTVVDWILSNR